MTSEFTNRVDSIKARHPISGDQAIAVAELWIFYRIVLDQLLVEEAARQGDDAAGEVIAALMSHWDADTEQLALTGENLLRALNFLVDPNVAIALTLEANLDPYYSAVALGMFAEAALPLISDEARPGALWLRACALERLGEIAKAEAVLLDADRNYPEWGPISFSLVRYAIERSDIERGVGLLGRKLDRPQYEMCLMLKGVSAKISGFDFDGSCWCGSGRQLEECYVHDDPVPLDVRASWLYQKAASVLIAPIYDRPTEFEHEDLIRRLVQARTRFGEAAHSTMDGSGAIHDELVYDVALFEGGAFAEFLDSRGFLLPDDERELARQWLLGKRAVYQVARVISDNSVALREARTGDDVGVVLIPKSHKRMTDGEFYCARVVSANGAMMQILAAVEPVMPSDVDSLSSVLIDGPDPVKLVARLSRRLIPTN